MGLALLGVDFCYFESVLVVVLVQLVHLSPSVACYNMRQFKLHQNINALTVPYS